MLNIKKNKGFSLAEMMVVMLMLSIIFAAAAPILTKRATQTSEVVSGGDSTPAGVITAFGGTTAPEGWVLCDGSSYSTSGKYEKLYNAIKYVYGGSGTTFNVPDLRGIFIRGAGTSNKLYNAKGSAFSSSLGNYQNDKLQGHWHYNYMVMNGATGTTGWQWNGTGGTFTCGGSTLSSIQARTIISDTTNGFVRIGTETNPANLSLNYIIKY